MPRLNIGSVDLTEDEIAWLQVVSNLSGESIRAQLRQVIKGHLIRFKPQYCKQINYVARKYGLSFEDAFAMLAIQQPPLGEIVEEFPISEIEEVTNFGVEVNVKPSPKLPANG